MTNPDLHQEKKNLRISCVTNRNDHCALREITPELKHPVTGPEEGFTPSTSSKCNTFVLFLNTDHKIRDTNIKLKISGHKQLEVGISSTLQIMAANKTGKQRKTTRLHSRLAHLFRLLLNSSHPFTTLNPLNPLLTAKMMREKKERKKCQSARNIFVSSSLARKNKSLMSSNITSFL